MTEADRSHLWCYRAMPGEEVSPPGPAGLLDELLGPLPPGRREQRRLNLGCGRDVRPGWTNLDSVRPAELAPPMSPDSPTAFVIHDLDSERRLPFVDDWFTEVEASHLLEHIRDPLGMAERLHRVCAPGATWTVKCPHGASDDAWGDLTHVRSWFPESFLYFGQPTYWRADYGYRGDWRLERVILKVRSEFMTPGVKAQAVLLQTQRLRNVVLEMEAQLSCVKPIRAQDRSLMDGVRYEIQVASIG